MKSFQGYINFPNYHSIYKLFQDGTYTSQSVVIFEFEEEDLLPPVFDSDYYTTKIDDPTVRKRKSTL